MLCYVWQDPRKSRGAGAQASRCCVWHAEVQDTTVVRALRDVFSADTHDVQLMSRILLSSWFCTSALHSNAALVTGRQHIGFGTSARSYAFLWMAASVQSHIAEPQDHVGSASLLSKAPELHQLRELKHSSCLLTLHHVDAQGRLSLRIQQHKASSCCCSASCPTII